MEQLALVFEEEARSIEQQTGWRRPHPQMLLQNIDLLQKVTSFDYDLLDPDFVQYAHARGCMNGAGAPEESDPDHDAHGLRMQKLGQEFGIRQENPFNGDVGQLRRWVREPWRTFEEFMVSDDLKFTLGGKELPAEHRRVTWKCIQIARGRLQDCWEIFQNLPKLSVARI